MKRLNLIALMVAVVAIMACDSLDELTQFKINYDQEVVIQSSAVVDLPFNVFTPEINSNSESTFENNDTHKDLIEHIELRSMTLEISTPTDGNFNFLNSIQIYISAENEEEVRIAWKDDIPANSSKVIHLDTSSDDLKAFIKKDAFKLRLETVTDELITSDHHIDVRSEFFVDAKILGL